MGMFNRIVSSRWGNQPIPLLSWRLRGTTGRVLSLFLLHWLMCFYICPLQVFELLRIPFTSVGKACIEMKIPLRLIRQPIHSKMFSHRWSISSTQSLIENVQLPLNSVVPLTSAKRRILSSKFFFISYALLLSLASLYGAYAAIPLWLKARKIPRLCCFP